MRKALRGKDIGAVIRAWRHHPAHGPRPIPQTDLARWLGITQGQLSRIENGHSRVRDLDKLSHYALSLGVPAELLWFDIDEPTPAAVPTTEMLQLSSGAVDAAIAASKPVLAESLLTTLDEYVLTDNLTGPCRLLPIVAQQVHFVEHLVGGSHGPTRTKLRNIHARFAEFLGWLHQDAGNLRTAIEWTTTAAGIARESRDDRLLSYIRLRQSNLAADSGNPQATIDLARAALRTPASLTPRLHAMALQQLAHGHARLGAAGDCARNLEQAWDHAARPDGVGDPLADYCTPEYIAMEAASCLIDLGNPERAITTLEPRLPCWQPENRRDLGRGLALFAVALARTGQPDQALDVAEYALAITAETRSSRTEIQLYRVVQHLVTADAPDRAAALRSALRRTLR